MLIFLHKQRFLLSLKRKELLAGIYVNSSYYFRATSREDGAGTRPRGNACTAVK